MAAKRPAQCRRWKCLYVLWTAKRCADTRDPRRLPKRPRHAPIVRAAEIVRRHTPRGARLVSSTSTPPCRDTSCSPPCTLPAGSAVTMRVLVLGIVHRPPLASVERLIARHHRLAHPYRQSAKLHALAVMLGRGPAARHRSLREALVAPLLAERLVGYDGDHVPCAVRSISQGGVCLRISRPTGFRQPSISTSAMVRRDTAR